MLPGVIIRRPNAPGVMVSARGGVDSAHLISQLGPFAVNQVRAVNILGNGCVAFWGAL